MKMPPLPPYEMLRHEESDDEMFTADQMRAYGEECARLAREEAARIADGYAVDDWIGAEGARRVAAAIRNGVLREGGEVTDRTSEIERLAANVHQKRELFRMMSAMNSFGLTAEEAVRQTQAYEVARAEMWQAENELQNAQLSGVFGGRTLD